MSLPPKYWLDLAEAEGLKRQPDHWFRLRTNIDYEDSCTGETTLSGVGFEVRTRHVGEKIGLRKGAEHLHGRYDLFAMWPGETTHWFVGVGPVANGSVLLAPLSPFNM